MEDAIQVFQWYCIAQWYGLVLVTIAFKCPSLTLYFCLPLTLKRNQAGASRGEKLYSGCVVVSLGPPRLIDWVIFFVARHHFEDFCKPCAHFVLAAIQATLGWNSPLDEVPSLVRLPPISVPFLFNTIPIPIPFRNQRLVQVRLWSLTMRNQIAPNVYNGVCVWPMHCLHCSPRFRWMRSEGNDYF